MNPVCDFQRPGRVGYWRGEGHGPRNRPVVLADLDADLAEHEAQRIVGEGGTAIGAACDVADHAPAERGRGEARMALPRTLIVRCSLASLIP
jgi:hypothetical protein